MTNETTLNTLANLEVTALKVFRKDLADKVESIIDARLAKNPEDFRGIYALEEVVCAIEEGNSERVAKWFIQALEELTE